ncbi:class I SAM-dependent methyltransferase [Promicromonospora sp. NPDC059942]|uniref:class I SAM-dependent methyltransferase n=1 Tax=Promicromonospora sp. NPDC059942 TaxID=3347009 RepID=UPI0036481713
MDIRTVRDPIVRAGRRWLRRVNDRHPWSHNDHFHGWVLRRLPVQRLRVLDVGCGRGLLLSRLRGRFDEVLGVDADADMASIAAERFAGDPSVTVRRARFEEVDGTFDAVTMIAVLHHLPLEAALRHAAELLTPGGRLLVVGLARSDSLADLAWDLPSSLLNPLVGLVKHPQPVRVPVDNGGSGAGDGRPGAGDGRPGTDGGRPSAGDGRPSAADGRPGAGDGGGNSEPEMPVRDPAETFAEISRTARAVLPGARVRRRLFFRYTLEWTRPR